MNDAIENLEIFMEEKEHQRRRHGSAIVGRVPYRLTVAEKIVSIEKYRKEETFDIIMEEFRKKFDSKSLCRLPETSTVTHGHGENLPVSCWGERGSS